MPASKQSLHNKLNIHPAVEAEWLNALFPNSSRESPEGHEFESHLKHVYMVPHNFLRMDLLYTAYGIWYKATQVGFAGVKVAQCTLMFTPLRENRCTLGRWVLRVECTTQSLVYNHSLDIIFF